MNAYQRRSVVAPRISGIALRAMVWLLESRVLGPLLLSKLTGDSGLEDFRAQSAGDASPTALPLPLDALAPAPRPAVELAAEAVAAPEVARGKQRLTVAALGAAYRDGRTDPLQVVQLLHEHIVRLDQGPRRMAFFISRKPQEVLEAAARSAERLRRGQPLSVLDGVRVAVKDEIELRHRQRITRDWLEQLKAVDAVVTPTCPISAPLIPESALPFGESNLPVVDALMRFIRQGNVTGLPAISVPAGYDRSGLPVGVQLMGHPYAEHLLLRLARVVEAAVEWRAPQVHVRVLP